MPRLKQLRKVVSGGQSGVDRAALDAAIEAGFATGGWCPKGRRAEDGTLPECYLLRETPTVHYSQRTEWNVRDSDATLVLTRGDLVGGTRLTVDLARRLQRPCFVVTLVAGGEVDEVTQWLRSHQVGILNVAGPRESTRPGIYPEARQFMRKLLARVTEPAEI
ncbi:MAG: molybdenum cofactor carrier [Gammaproteobacteria bacterium SG8_47]|nr:MAG: molybdenum cofactor carrier [Gammaproteobacteria bacterium SG8_47]